MAEPAHNSELLNCKVIINGGVVGAATLGTIYYVVTENEQKYRGGQYGWSIVSKGG